MLTNFLNVIYDAMNRDIESKILNTVTETLLSGAFQYSALFMIIPSLMRLHIAHSLITKKTFLYYIAYHPGTSAKTYKILPIRIDSRYSRPK